MIITLTMNPSVDYFIQVKGELMETEVNRSKEVMLKAAGKGINVSKVLDSLGMDSAAIALLGGFTGDFIKEQLLKFHHIQLMEVRVNESNRINVKIHQDEKALCINAAGPQADKSTEEEILKCFDFVSESDFILISGSMMKGLNEEFLYRLSMKVHEKGAKLILDMESLSYERLVQCKPYLIKPNRYEFQLLMNQKEIDIPTMKPILHQMHQDGIENILVSLGAEGALLQTSSGLFQMTQEKVLAINKVGCGDAMLAAFIGKLSSGNTIEEALRFAGAAGCAAVSTMDELTAEDISSMLHKITVNRF